MAYGDDMRPGETPQEYAGRKHDEAHGQVCDCLWARMNGRGALLLGTLDTTPEGQRLEVRHPEDNGDGD
jgi:hypothetical protein